MLITILPICIAGGVGWYYLLQRPCNKIEIIGTEYVDPESVHKLIEAVFSAPLAVDRLQRHPWIRGVRAVCYPTGTLQIKIQERLPRLLVLTSKGDPAYYLDEFSYMMPISSDVIFDVPLVRGITGSYNPLLPIRDSKVQNLTTLLSRLPAEITSLISEIELTENGAKTVMRFTGLTQTTVVLLGHEDWEKRLLRLYAFWNQGDWPLGDQAVALIDLRFRGQIITREIPI